MNQQTAMLMSVLSSGGGYTWPTCMKSRYKEAKSKNPNKAKNKAERQRKKRGRK